MLYEVITLVDMLFHLRLHPRLAEEGQKHQPEHVEGGDPRGDRPHRPEGDVAMLSYNFV